MLWELKEKAKDYFLRRLTKDYFEQEYNKQKDVNYNERPVEYSFIFRRLAELYPERILDIGTGITALPRLMQNCGFVVTAMDNVRDYWSSNMINRYYYVADDDITNSELNDKFDLITCVSVIEHIEKVDDAIKNIFSLLKPNGHLLITFPYSDDVYIKNVYEREDSVCFKKELPYITQSFSRNVVEKWLDDNNGVILDQEFWQIWTGEYWSEGEELIPPKKASQNSLHQHTCIHIQKKKLPTNFTN